MKRYRRISQLLYTISTMSDYHPMYEHHMAHLDAIRNELPSGSGFDAGSQLDNTSKPDRLVITTSFHHMNDTGYYTGWTDHKIIITPSLHSAFHIQVTGRDRNGIKGYIGDVFYQWLVENTEY